MARKFYQSELDILYEQLRIDEEVLWRGKPELIANINTVISSILFLLSSVLFTILVSNNNMDSWFFYSLIGLDLFILLYIINYIVSYYLKYKYLFYCITNSRVIIFDYKNKRIEYTKKFQSIKLLKIKKTIYKTGSIVFDIDLNDERVIDIGFENINEPDNVFNIINHQLHHARNKG